MFFFFFSKIVAISEAIIVAIVRSEICSIHYMSNYLGGGGECEVLLLPEPQLAECGVSIVKDMLCVSCAVEHVITWSGS